MTTTPAELTPQARSFESERIHASSRVLLLATIGLAVNAVGFFMVTSAAGAWLGVVGSLLLVVAVVLHFDHLSFRVGRNAVVLVILGTVVSGIQTLSSALLGPGKGPSWLFGVAWVLGGVGIAAIAVHKEGQMKAMLAEYASGAPWQAQVTVYASFLSLITGATGVVLLGIGFSGPYFQPRMQILLIATAGVLAAIGVISHVEHLIPRIGLAAVIAGVVAPIIQAANLVHLAADPSSWDPNTFFGLIATSYLVGSLACLLAFLKKRSTDS
ncbi:MAG: hypothetical protein WCI29_11280 [Actinomycetes bacterium]